MGVSWTTEQQQVITLSGRNLLVSAAAGSGKTAVLVERIIQKITSEKHPVDIDRMLVVTFTKAAASEMRERISKAIEKKRAENPEDINLARQASLIHNAQITTIDSFCAYVVRNHFGEINLDPNFRIADSGELHLMEKDVMDQLFETCFEEGREDFLHLVDAYSSKRNAENVKDMVFKIYRESQSCPWPIEWIRSLNANYMMDSPEALLEAPIMQAAAETLRRKLTDFKTRIQKQYDLAADPYGVEKYIPGLLQDLEKLEAVDELRTFGELSEFLGGFEPAKLPVIRAAKGINMEAKETIQEDRKNLKKDLQDLQKTFGGDSQRQVYEQAKRMAPTIRELTNLTERFWEAMTLQKQKKKILDFADVEHYALNILVDEQTHASTKTAEEFRHYYEEIMIDEYQDSNQVQEEILTSISRMENGSNNMFMVGDVKQSIYRFRQARPELFMEKHRTYTKEDSTSQKIELHRNFRSRASVLEFCNDIFYKIMHTDLGNVAYDDDAALYPGASYPEAEGLEPQLLLLEKKAMADSDVDLGDSADEENKKSLEAAMTAAEIKRLMAEVQVTDKATGALRPMRYSDIVILFRSLKDWGTTFAEVLKNYGIPAHVESTVGYFSAIEVQTVLNFLRILDNPYQDIPMAAVLKSAFVGMDEESLAEIRLKHKAEGFAEAVVREMRLRNEAVMPEDGEQPNENQPKEKKIKDNLTKENQTKENQTEDPWDASPEFLRFCSLYKRFRTLAAELPIHELIQKLLRESGYGAYVSCLPAGTLRAANLDMLVEKAIAYEKTSYKGLFHFVRYIDQLQKYEVDYGEADVTGENADVVHIMTIHKSKGLEFPVVFVSGIFKKFNLRDVQDSMVLHTDLGIGLREQTATPKIKRDSLFHAQIAEEIVRESLGEELRVLYVALTRAKEKLILTGLIDDREKLYKKCSGYVFPKQPIPYAVRRGAVCYGEWLVSAVLSYPDKYEVTFREPEDLLLARVQETAEGHLELEDLLLEINRADRQQMTEMEQCMSFVYPFASDISRKSKYSVSELKHASMTLRYDQTDGEAEVPTFLLQDKESYIPDFIAAEKPAEQDGQILLDFDLLLPDLDGVKGQGRKDAKISAGVNQGALRGTAVHRVMECMHFAELCDVDRTDERAVRAFVKKELDRITTSGELTPEMRELVIPSMIGQFVRSGIAGRMAQADRKQRLYREKPFVMMHDDVLIQGIIDAFWLETGADGSTEVVLLDYKTDRVSSGEELIMRYQTQIDLYADVLSRIFSTKEKGVKVKERYLYSYRLQEEIRI